MLNDTTTIRPHRRQFIISSEKISFRDDWVYIKLDETLHLTHCPELKVNKLNSSRNENTIILGEAFNTGATDFSNVEELLNTTRKWAGKWALISDGKIASDAAALMGVYYSHSEKLTLVTSSPKIAQEILHSEYRSKRKLGWYGMNWFPPPLTPLRNVRKLLSDQVYDISKSEIRHIKRLDEEQFKSFNRGQVAHSISSNITETLQQLSENGILKLALTAGIDSRILLSVLLSNDIPFSTYTLEHPLISEADKKIPLDLSKEFGFEHSFIKLQKPNADRIQIFENHLGGFMEDADRFFIERTMFDSFNSECYLVRGGGWELGRKFYNNKLSGIKWKTFKDDPTEVVKNFLHFGSVDSSCEELKAWAAWRNVHNYSYDWKDIFYLDQRMGGWLSGVELALDINHAKSFHPFSSSELFDLILVDTENESFVGNEVILLNEKRLLNTPINPDWDSQLKKRFENIRRYPKALLNELQNYRNK